MGGGNMSEYYLSIFLMYCRSLFFQIDRYSSGIGYSDMKNRHDKHIFDTCK
jgi:hypothetical protein